MDNLNYSKIYAWINRNGQQNWISYDPQNHRINWYCPDSEAAEFSDCVEYEYIRDIRGKAMLYKAGRETENRSFIFVSDKEVGGKKGIVYAVKGIDSGDDYAVDYIDEKNIPGFITNDMASDDEIRLKLPLGQLSKKSFDDKYETGYNNKYILPVIDNLIAGKKVIIYGSRQMTLNILRRAVHKLPKNLANGRISFRDSAGDTKYFGQVDICCSELSESTIKKFVSGNADFFSITTAGRSDKYEPSTYFCRYMQINNYRVDNDLFKDVSDYSELEKIAAEKYFDCLCADVNKNNVGLVIELCNKINAEFKGINLNSEKIRNYAFKFFFTDEIFQSGCLNDAGLQSRLKEFQPYKKDVSDKDVSVFEDVIYSLDTRSRDDAAKYVKIFYDIYNDICGASYNAQSLKKILGDLYSGRKTGVYGENLLNGLRLLLAGMGRDEFIDYISKLDENCDEKLRDIVKDQVIATVKDVDRLKVYKGLRNKNADKSYYWLIPFVYGEWLLANVSDIAQWIEEYNLHKSDEASKKELKKQFAKACSKLIDELINKRDLEAIGTVKKDWAEKIKNMFDFDIDTRYGKKLKELEESESQYNTALKQFNKRNSRYVSLYSDLIGLEKSSNDVNKDLEKSSNDINKDIDKLVGEVKKKNKKSKEMLHSLKKDVRQAFKVSVFLSTIGVLLLLIFVNWFFVYGIEMVTSGLNWLPYINRYKLFCTALMGFDPFFVLYGALFLGVIAILISSLMYGSKNQLANREISFTMLRRSLILLVIPCIVLYVAMLLCYIFL